MPYVKKMGVSTLALVCCPTIGLFPIEAFFKTLASTTGATSTMAYTSRNANVAGWQISSVVEPKRTLAVMEWTASAHCPARRPRPKGQHPFYCDARSVVGFVDGHVPSPRFIRWVQRRLHAGSHRRVRL